ncbi:FAD-dependent oxidoreductase [Novacetimonas hansenii]|uniref:D-amino-acid oxidase n=2 Tax=Novacetimonas hansenii TaxID=436 RepID=A0AAW5EU26_NOVHA|nr:FAD-dependent oxidoreductase [Novacetimonas hansenii]MCJ8354232.1 FAD-binding oxidoreductase [Novacetimonas hansenii]
MTRLFHRRNALMTAASLAGFSALPGCAGARSRRYDLDADVRHIPVIRARTDRIDRITVCLRPFRASGPRLGVEQVGRKSVVHNYGHGGSGWSLSWGTAQLAVERAVTASGQKVGVIGCGAIGLTTAIVAQQAGAQVTIYAREMPPFVRSARASGSWTPASRIAKTSDLTPEFTARWERMARYSFSCYQNLQGLPGNPVEWDTFYGLQARARRPVPPDPIGFAEMNDRLRDIEPQGNTIPVHDGRLPYDEVRKQPNLIFNVTTYTDYLMRQFFERGGKIRTMTLHHPSELTALPEPVFINCTGYGARALWNDQSIIPIRGQIAWLIPQPEALFSMEYDNVYVVSRRDGIVVQWQGEDMGHGYNRTDETPDLEEAHKGVSIINGLYKGMGYNV